jgi:hypothetical protein
MSNAWRAKWPWNGCKRNSRLAKYDSSVTYGELAAGGRTRQVVEEDLKLFTRIDLDFAAAWRAGAAFGRSYPAGKEPKPMLPDFLIRG